MYKGWSLLVKGTISRLVNPLYPAITATRSRESVSFLSSVKFAGKSHYLLLHRLHLFICLSIRLVSFWICRISFIYISMRTPLSIKWRQFLLYQNGSFLVVAYCIIVFSLSYLVLICQIFPMWFLDVIVSFVTYTWKVYGSLWFERDIFGILLGCISLTT